MDELVFCELKHIPSKKESAQISSNIENFVKPKVYDKTGIKNCGAGGDDTIRFSVTRKEANGIRDMLSRVLPSEDSPIWFSIISDPLNALIPRSLETTHDPQLRRSTFSVRCEFGSLRSYNQFYSHTSLDNKNVNLSFNPTQSPPSSLSINYDNMRIVLPFDSIQKQNILVNKYSKNGVYILIPFKYTPCIYRLEPNEHKKMSGENTTMSQNRLCADEKNVPFIQDISLSSDVVFYFPPSEDMPWMFLAHFLIERPDQWAINFSCFKSSPWNSVIHNRGRPNPFDYQRASFEDRYSLQILISLGYVFRDKWADLTDQELNWHNWPINQRTVLCHFAIDQLQQDHGYDLRRTRDDYEKTAKTKKKSSDDRDDNGMLVDNRERLQVACCTLTPLRIVFQPLEITTGSRALRNPQFGGPENFLLVHFREENNKQLRVTSRNIKERLKSAMENGIDLFNKTYRYFGASTGQMKEMAFWFIDLPSNLRDMSEAYRLIGNFDGIKNIATYIARVGQYFSNTWPVNITLTKVNDQEMIRPNDKCYVLKIDDIERNNYCFTDGIGKISWGLAGLVAKKMNLPLFRKEDIPSAFQVRVAGCKGMVAIDPASTLNDYYIHVRGSMMKFESDDWNLEICDHSRPMTLTLNNQVIRLLSDLGNTREAFIALQNQGFIQWQIPEEEQPTAIEIAARKNISYSLSKDHLLKNRIPIPPEEGRNMFGVADETGTLEYGECFIQYSSFSPTRSRQQTFSVHTGTVIVTKNPCLWPGDFRRLKAVRNEKLQECMRDVIVFPVKGERPHSNEIAGSDLDGDQYWVYWGDRFEVKENIEPLSYVGAKKQEVPKIDQKIIIEHIVNSFGASIMLGMISNTHTVVAEKHPQHTMADECKQLAILFSIAVDSPKTGQFIDKKEIRIFQQKYCDSWPEYMRKYDERVYQSTSVLNELFKRATEKYFELKETPLFVNSLQQIKTTTAMSTNKVYDKRFKEWLETGVCGEDQRSGAKAKQKTNLTSSTEELEESLPIKDKKSSQSISAKSKTSRTRRSSSRPPSSVTSNPEVSSKMESAGGKSLNHVQTSDGTASSTPLPLVLPNGSKCNLDFLILTDTNPTVRSDIHFSEIDNHCYTVHLNKEKASNIADKQCIVQKLITYMEKLDILKKKHSVYNETTHGMLSLFVCYGRILVNNIDSMPRKLGELRNLIKDDPNDLPFHFQYTNINELNTDGARNSSARPMQIVYEFDCHTQPAPSQYFTLLYDRQKVLKKIRIYNIWFKCFVRLPDCNTDSLCEIRSTKTYDAGSSDFDGIFKLIFKSNNIEFLTGRKPKITINKESLSASITPLSLKIIDEEQSLHAMSATTEHTYRKIEQIPINVQQKEIIPLPTLEYQAIPVNKQEEILTEVCRLAFHPALRN